MNTQELVTAAQNGNPDAFAELWRMYRPEIARMIYRRTSDPDLTDDLTSEVFLRAWRRLPTFTWRGNGFAGWLTTIARNLVIDHYITAARRPVNSQPIDDTDHWHPPATDRRTNPEAVAEQADLAEALDRAIARLTPYQQQVIRLRFGAGLPLADTAKHLKRRAVAVQSAQFLATRALAADSDLAGQVAA
ncbi:RNA polymerase sigma factor [Micromonospora maritima]|uniref:RNA polymerase sigma factor n=1 Tax=Micromonospora maritima TaxID=986711 RepID=UPI00157CBECA|nr:sigma-70 family RNA polymerase sigma factor [Micromonospora maritima]